MTPLQAIRCQCLQRRPLETTRYTREELETLLRSGMGEKVDQPEMQRLIDRVMELQRKREA